MAGTNTGVAQIPNAINNFYDRVMLKAARPLLVHLRWAQVKDIPRNETATIKFRRYSLLSAATTALTEGVTPSGSQLSAANITATVLQYGDFITLTDKLVFTTQDPILTEQADLLGQQAGNTLDQLTRNVIGAGSTIQFASTAGSTAAITASMKMTRAEIREAVRTLHGNDAVKITRMMNPSTGFNTSPVNAAFVGIISHNTLFDLKQATGWIPVEEYGSQKNVMEGEVGALDEVRFVMTTNALTEASTVTVHHTLILATNFYAITRISGEAMRNIIKPLGSGGTSDPLDQVQTTGWKAAFVAVILNDNFAVRIEHAVSS